MIYKKLRQIVWVFAVLIFAQTYADGPCFDSCPPDFCCDNDCCNNFWFDADYLYWRLENSPNHTPLVIAGPEGALTTPFLGEPGTRVVLGGKRTRTDWRSGGRFELGYWFDNDLCCGNNFGVAVNYFFLPNKKRHHCVFSDGELGSILLSVPYFDVTTNTETSIPIAVPGSYFRRSVS